MFTPLLLLLFTVACRHCIVLASALPQGDVAFDIIVYGATPAGVLAADAAAGENASLSVLLMDPRWLVGGAMSGGLAATDLGTTTAVIGGRTRKFFCFVAAAYNTSVSPYDCSSPKWDFEPHVAEAIFSNTFLASKPNLKVLMGTRIVSVGCEDGGPAGRRITNVTTDDGRIIHTKMVIDTSYEGFLLPLVPVPFAYGRESALTYNESAAGVASPVDIPGTYNVQPQLWVEVDPYWENGTLIPLVNAAPPGPLGSGDDRTQSYMYRVTLCKNTSNLVPWPRPDKYDNRTYELFRRKIVKDGLTRLTEVVGLGTKLPGGYKFDSNSQTLDPPGMSWPYPQAVANADWDAQQAVWNGTRDFQLGLLHWLQTDPSIPPSIANDTHYIGLPADEYSASPHNPYPGFPPQLYVREALRMRSDFVFTQADREVSVTKPDSIAMGAYTVDVIHVSRYANGSGVWMEGGIQAPSFLQKGLPPFAIPYRAIVPPKSSAVNLLVPVALSSSHVGFCSIRLEPTWMPLGESAGVAAALALSAGVAVQDVDISALQGRLRELGQVLELP